MTNIKKKAATNLGNTSGALC